MQSFNQLQASFTFFLILILFPSSLHCDDKATFLWASLLNVPSSTFSASLLPPYVNFTEDVLRNGHVGGECRAAVAHALDALASRQLWASALFNSWAKFPPSGTLVGTLVDFGDYDQCLGLETRSGGDGRTAYCLVDVALPMPRPMPNQHNYFHPTGGLLPSQAEVESSNNSSIGASREAANNTSSNFLNDHQFTSVYLEEGSVYRHLERISSVFYYEELQIGVCWPANCSQLDVAQVMRKGKHWRIIIMEIILLLLNF